MEIIMINKQMYNQQNLTRKKLFKLLFSSITLRIIHQSRTMHVILSYRTYY